MGFAGGLNGKESACSAEDLGLIPGLGRCPGEGTGNLLQYSCSENSMDRGPGGLQSSPWGHKELDTTEQLTQSSYERDSCGSLASLIFLKLYITKLIFVVCDPCENNL